MCRYIYALVGLVALSSQRGDVALRCMLLKAFDFMFYSFVISSNLEVSAMIHDLPFTRSPHTAATMYTKVNRGGELFPDQLLYPWKEVVLYSPIIHG